MDRLTAICKSEKQNITLEFSILFDPEKEPIETLGTDWIEEGLTEAFWENSERFDNNINDVSAYNKFTLSYYLNGGEAVHIFDVNADRLMQGLLSDFSSQNQ